MNLRLKVLAPDQSVFDGNASEVILPSTSGLLGILPGHISMVTAIDIGVLRVRVDQTWKSIALMGGFAEVESDDVTVLVNSAAIGDDIDKSSAEKEYSEAKQMMTKFENETNSTEKIKATESLNKARAIFQASKAES